MLQDRCAFLRGVDACFAHALEPDFLAGGEGAVFYDEVEEEGAREEDGGAPVLEVEGGDGTFVCGGCGDVVFEVCGHLSVPFL